MTQDYNVMLADETAVMRDKVRRGMLPLVARNPALDRATKAYALAQATLYDGKRAQLVEQGRSPNTLPIPYRNNALLDRCADLVLYEELTWSHPDKMSIVEYPVMSDRNTDTYYRKYTHVDEMKYGDMRSMGTRKIVADEESSGDGVKTYVDSRRVIPPTSPLLDESDARMDLYRALDSAGLTDRQREALDCVYLDDLTHSEAGKAMGVSRRAVGQFVDAALAKLRAQMCV